MNLRSHTRDSIQKLLLGKYLVITLFAFLLTTIFAQSNSGDVTGTIVDASGAAIQDATSPPPMQPQTLKPL